LFSQYPRSFFLNRLSTFLIRGYETPSRNPKCSTCFLCSFARADVDKIAKLNVTIDGKSLPDLKKFRVESPPFDVTHPEDNIWGVKGGPTRAAGDGYWLFMKPLPQGNHQIQFGGSCLAGTINIGTL
jgi:hypothetical protein